MASRGRAVSARQKRPRPQSATSASHSTSKAQRGGDSSPSGLNAEISPTCANGDMSLRFVLQSKQHQTVQGCMSAVTDMIGSPSDTLVWQVTLSKMEGCPTLLRFLVSAAAAQIFANGMKGLQAAVSSLFEEGRSLVTRLPPRFLEEVEKSQRESARILWEACRSKIQLEAQVAAGVAAQLEAQSVRGPASAAEQLKELQQVVKLVSSRVRRQLSDELASLHSISSIVRLDQKPADANLAAVWEEFQAVRELYAALIGGVDTFKQWVGRMTSVRSSTLDPVWDRWDSEYHSIERSSKRPGVFVGGRVQVRSNAQHGGAGSGGEQYAVAAARGSDTGQQPAAEAGGNEWHDDDSVVLPTELEGVTASPRQYVRTRSSTQAAAVGPRSPAQGFRRVLATYQAQGEDSDDASSEVFDEFAGLLVNLPVVHGRMMQDKDAIGSFPLTLPGSAETVKLGGKEVRVMRILLTVPRLHFLWRVADALATSNPGIMLHGVRGAGKSAMLQALVSIMAVGGESDVLYSPSAKELASLDVENLMEAALHGSSVLAEQLLSGKYAPDQAAIAGPRWAGRFFSGLWTAVQRSEAQQSQGVAATDARLSCAKAVFDQLRCSSTQPQMVILDEVHELVRTVSSSSKPEELQEPAAHQHASALHPELAAYWGQWLLWKYCAPAGNFRVLSGPPDGMREETTLLSMSSEFELRPAPADHIAAVLQSEPQYLGQAPPFSMSPQQCLQVCEELGSNARFIARFLGNDLLMQRAGKQSVANALFSEVHRCEVSLAEHLNTSLEEQCPNQTPQALIAASGAGGEHNSHGLFTHRQRRLFASGMCDASLVVRGRALSCFGPNVLSGLPALRAIVRTVGQDSPLGVLVLSRVRAEQFEPVVRAGIAMGAAARRMRPIASLHTDLGAACDGHQLLEARRAHGVFASEVGSASLRLHRIFSSYEQQATCSFMQGATATKQGKQPVSILSGNVVLPVKTLLKSARDKPRRVMLHTVSGFPGVGAVSIDFVGSAAQVTFWQITTGTLEAHAASRGPVPCFLADGSKDGSQVLQVQPALRDLLASHGNGNSCCWWDAATQAFKVNKDGHNTVALEEGAEVLPGGEAWYMNDSITSGTSPVNCLLAMLGVPLIVKRQLVAKQQAPRKSSNAKKRKTVRQRAGKGCTGAGQKKAARRVTQCRLKLSLVQSAALCDALHGKGKWKAQGITSWEFRMVCVSELPLESNLSSQYEDLEAAHVYAVLRDDVWF